MPGALVQHSHRRTTKVTNKPFKSRRTTKGALRDAAKGKLPLEVGSRKTPHQQVMSKLDRRNQAKQKQREKLKARQKEASIFAGRDGAPRNVAVVPLCADCDAKVAIRRLNNALDIEVDVPSGPFRAPVDRFKQMLQYMPLSRDLTACLDAARVADYVVLILSAEAEVDALGELILRSIESQGVSTLFTVVQHLDRIESAKTRPSVVASLRSFITHFHPDQDKIYSLDNVQECTNLMRSLCGTTPKGVKWRDERSWMLVEDIKFPSPGESSTVLTGVVRGKGLKADRIVQVSDWGTFEISKITVAPLAKRPPKTDQDMIVDDNLVEEVLERPADDRDNLDDLAPEEIMEDAEQDMDDMATTATGATKKGVLLDSHHYFSDDEDAEVTVTKRVPKGTSSYQAAWYLDDDVSDSGSDLEDFEMKDAADDADTVAPDDGMDVEAEYAATEAGPSEYPQSERMQPDEEEDAEQLKAYRAKKRDEAGEDLEFPDEIELHPDVLARERLARYRGLKSLRTSEWQEDEDRAHEPQEWRRLLRIPDYRASRIRCAHEALVGGVAPGTRVHVYINHVPPSFQQSYDRARPITLFSLLRHENKCSAVNFLISLSSDAEVPIKSKEELIVQCGPRRFVVSPLFSQTGYTPNNVHKFCRFLHPGQSAVATFMGPVTWGSVPALFFKRQSPDEATADVVAEGDGGEGEDSPSSARLPLTLIATGTALPPSTSRVIAKRVILTGHPYQIHKKVVTVRYMFFNREDVLWFKALPLWTKRGRSGHIKEALGTHGYFKAVFDGRINPQDTIGVSLYKRVWPRRATAFRGSLFQGSRSLESQGNLGGGETVAMDAEVIS